MMRKKYIWVINGSEGFGVSRATLSIALGLRGQGVTVDFLTFSAGVLSNHLIQHDFRVTDLNIKRQSVFDKKVSTLFKRIPQILTDSINYSNKIKEFLIKENYEVLIYRGPDLSPIISLIQGVKISKFWIMPNEISKYPFSINKRMYQVACLYGKIHVVANSHYTATTIAGLGVKLSVLHLGVDDERFDSEIIPTDDLVFQKNDLVFGIFARLTIDKAQDIVIEAFSLLKKEYPALSLKLLLIGADINSVFYQECLNVIQRCDIGADVIVKEKVENIESYYPLVNVMINSRRDAEPFGLSIVEAMLMEKPVLAYKLGGPSETIIDGVTGWLIDEPTVECYYKGMSRSVVDKGLWSAYGKNGKERALENFTTEKVVENLIKIIN